MFRKLRTHGVLYVMSKCPRYSLATGMWRNRDDCVFILLINLYIRFSLSHETSQSSMHLETYVLPVFAILVGSRIETVFIDVKNKQREPFQNSFRKKDLPVMSQHIIWSKGLPPHSSKRMFNVTRYSSSCLVADRTGCGSVCDKHEKINPVHLILSIPRGFRHLISQGWLGHIHRSSRLKYPSVLPRLVKTGFLQEIAY